RIEDMLRVAGMEDDAKEAVRDQQIAGRAALLAAKIGGKEAVQVAADKGLTNHAMETIAGAFNAFHEQTTHELRGKRKVRKALRKGQVPEAEDVKAKARRVKAAAARKPAIPPDLVDVMRGWTERARRWAEQLD